MQIATLNIDWARKEKTKIENELTKLNADILILTEAIEGLSLSAYDFVYRTKPLPLTGIFEGINYGELLNNKIPVRTIIYSKYEALRFFAISDEYTSVSAEINSPAGPLAIYATIVGTQFNKMPFAKKELDNCIKDCMRIADEVDHLCLAGDLNTSFDEGEKYFEITNISSRRALLELCNKCNLDLTTAGIRENIDHILLPEGLSAKTIIRKRAFVEKGIVSDHMGISVEILQI